jgi:ATP-dependent DNA helicase RecG
MSIVNAIQELIDRGESPSVELISSVDAHEQVARAVAAFLNTHRGTIVVEADQENADHEKLTKNQADKLEKYLRQKISPTHLFSVSLEDCSKGKLIVIDVPKGRDRPYVVNGAIYVRHGKAVKPATSDQIRKMVEEDTDQPRWERRNATGLQVEDLDERLIQQTVESATAKRSMAFSNLNNLPELLNEFSMMQFGNLTNAADVAFGIHVSKRHPQTRIRAVCYEIDRGGDRFVDDQLLEGPVLRTYEDAMAFFKRHVPIQVRFKPGVSKRETKPAYPFNSLREGLINALAHRDYEAYSGSVSLSVYPNRIEIWNSGKFPPGITTHKLEQIQHESILVNPDLANVFYLNQLMERVGRGTYNIIQECKLFGMRPPKWEPSESGVRLTLFSAASDVVVADELSERMTKLLTSLKTGGSTCLFEYVQQFQSEGLSDRQARRDLLELTRLGFLERFGSARATRYKRTELKLP